MKTRIQICVYLNAISFLPLYLLLSLLLLNVVSSVLFVFLFFFLLLLCDCVVLMLMRVETYVCMSAYIYTINAIKFRVCNIFHSRCYHLIVLLLFFPLFCSFNAQFVLDWQVSKVLISILFYFRSNHKLIKKIQSKQENLQINKKKSTAFK